MSSGNPILKGRFVIALLTLLAIWSGAFGLNPEREIIFKRARGTAYSLFNQVTRQTGLYFIYDSRVVDNSRRVRIPDGSYSLESAVHMITGNTLLRVKTEGDHALIYLPSQHSVEEDRQEIPKPPAGAGNLLQSKRDTLKRLSVGGRVLDRITSESIPYASVSVEGSTIGTVTNNDGEFRLLIPDSLEHSLVRISHMGFESRIIRISLLERQYLTYFLDPKIIPLQEVVVRVIDPNRTIREVVKNRSANYGRDPVYITSFYREGVEYRSSLTLSEAVLKIYKTGVNSSAASEQVKVLKMRKLSTHDNKDTLVTKIKSSINSSLLLDIAKNLPDFLSHESMWQYNYSHSDITVIDERRVYVISFEQKDDVPLPLFKGKVYIDAENYAIVKAEFSINQKYIKAAADDFIIKRSRGLDIIPEKISYSVSYRNTNGAYFINHVRGDLHFKVKRKKRFFSSDLHAWFEMVNCGTEFTDVTPFQKDERISTRDIFSETSFTYDKSFWDNFNIILPEENLTDYIGRYNFNK